LIEAARAESVAGIINFSTAHVYGAPLCGILTENTVPRPVHPYAIAHSLSENIVLAARNRGGPPGLILRVSNGFGAPTHRDIDRWSLLVNDLCRQAVTNRRLVLKSSGRQVRDFVTIGDIGAAVVFFLTQGTSAWEDGLFNLGGNNSLTILRMAESIAKRCNEVLGFEPEITVAEPPPGETCPDLVYSIDKLEKTGFRLTGDIESELDAELEFCQAEFGAGHLPVNPVK
jgi:UDP-glucose 4-epimerase